MSFDIRLREIQFKNIRFYMCCLYQKEKHTHTHTKGRMKERKKKREKERKKKLDNEEVTQKFKM